MAKKTPAVVHNDVTPDTDSGSADIAVLETTAELYNGPLVSDDALADKIAAYGQDNDDFNTWKPKAGEYKLLQLRGAKRVHIESQDIDSILVSFADLKTGRPVKTFLGDWLVKEMMEKGIHESGLPMLLTYQGMIRGRRGNGTKEIHNWQRYYYSQAEWNSLTGKK